MVVLVDIDKRGIAVALGLTKIDVEDKVRRQSLSQSPNRVIIKRECDAKIGKGGRVLTWQYMSNWFSRFQ